MKNAFDAAGLPLYLAPYGVVPTGHEQVGRCWVGLGWVGLGWVGLGWVGLGWVGLGWGCCTLPQNLFWPWPIAYMVHSRLDAFNCPVGLPTPLCRASLRSFRRPSHARSW